MREIIDMKTNGDSLIMYAEKLENGSFRHIFPSKLQLAMCGCKNPVKIKVTKNKTGKYWGWDDGESISMIYSRFEAFAICFPYGVDAAEKVGRGNRVKLDIEEIA